MRSSRPRPRRASRRARASHAGDADGQCPRPVVVDEQRRARLRVRPATGREVPQRRHHDRRGREVLLRALSRRERGAPQAEGRRRRDPGPLAGPLPPERAVARLHDVLRDPRDGSGVDRAEEVRREGRRRGLQEAAGGRRPLPLRLVQARRGARPRGARGVLAQAARHQDARLQGHPRRCDEAGRAQARRGRRGLWPDRPPRRRGAAHGRPHAQVGDDPGGPLPGLRRPVGAEVAVARPPGAPGRQPRHRPPGDQPGELPRPGPDLLELHPAGAGILLEAPLYPRRSPGARALLTDAGYPNGFDAGDLSGETFSGSGIGEPVVNDLNAVGIRVRRLRLLERATYLKQWGDKDAQEHHPRGQRRARQRRDQARAVRRHGRALRLRQLPRGGRPLQRPGERNQPPRAPPDTPSRCSRSSTSASCSGPCSSTRISSRSGRGSPSTASTRSPTIRTRRPTRICASRSADGSPRQETDR